MVERAVKGLAGVVAASTVTSDINRKAGTLCYRSTLTRTTEFLRVVAGASA